MLGFDFVAILGRGIQRLNAKSPVGYINSWALTEDLELCDETSAHLPVREPADDGNPFCMIGGGDMNFDAGLELVYRYKPKVVVCAYGGRSGYLESVNGPSESEVMSNRLMIQIENNHSVQAWQPGFPEVVIWKRDRQLPFQSNTRQELLNIFDLALERNLSRIALVTVGVHVPRTNAYIAKHFSVFEKYRDLSPVLFESEEILLSKDREKNTVRVEAMRRSESFKRNWAREADGIQKIVRDQYGDAKPKVVTV